MPIFYLDSGSIDRLEVSSSLLVSGTLTVSGSLNSTAGLTGSLQGTASWAQNVVGGGPSGQAFPYTGSAQITGSLGLTGSYVQGESSVASGFGSFVIGSSSLASGRYAFAVGKSATATADYSFAINYAVAEMEGDFAQGYGYASGSWSHAQGEGQSYGYASHAEGASTTEAQWSHAEGTDCITLYNGGSGNFSHAEGESTRTSGRAAHSEGYLTTASGDYSHAEGERSRAIGRSSHAEGLWTITRGQYQLAVGQYNASASTANSVFMIGNGTSDSNRSNLVFASGSQFQVTGSIRVSGSITSTSGFSVTSAVTASESLTAGDFVNMSTGGIRKASSTDTTRQAHGFVDQAYSANAAVTVLFSGTNTNVSGLTPGSRYFLSASGTEATVPPATAGQLFQEVGVALSPTVLLVNIGPAIVT